jgi:hypothetical protein
LHYLAGYRLRNITVAPTGDTLFIAVDNSCCTLGPTGTLGNSVATPAKGFILRMVYLTTLALPDTTRSIVPKQPETKSIHVYPNPAHGTLYVDLPPQARKPFLVQLYSTTGQLVKAEIDYEDHLPLSIGNIPPGIYLLHLIDGDGMAAPSQKVFIAP